MGSAALKIVITIVSLACMVGILAWYITHSGGKIPVENSRFLYNLQEYGYVSQEN